VLSARSAAPFPTEKLASAEANIPLLASRAKLVEDVPRIRAVRTTFRQVRILLRAKNNTEREFLQCVRSGINGCLAPSRSAKEV
jgi:hypothetical protein